MWRHNCKHCHWANRIVYLVPVKQPCRIWVKSNYEVTKHSISGNACIFIGTYYSKQNWIFRARQIKAPGLYLNWWWRNNVICRRMYVPQTPRWFRPCWPRLFFKQCGPHHRMCRDYYINKGVLTGLGNITEDEKQCLCDIKSARTGAVPITTVC